MVQSSTHSWIDKDFPPEFYLFFSVDIEGSTSFKNGVGGGRATWGPFFLDFFKSFPSNLSKCEADIERFFDSPGGMPFEPWKSLGDELIFTKKLNNGFDSFVAVCAAKQAIVDGSEQLRVHRENRGKTDEKNHYPTHLKGTMWLAGFPMKNMKVRRDGMPDDYIGPSIDLGFRLTKLSSPWHMAVSEPLAWMLSKIQTEQQSKLKGQSIEWVYRGRETLKGIPGGKAGYPVFCIDVTASTEGVSSEEKNLLSRGLIAPRDVFDFCETQFDNTGSQSGRHNRPFIIGDTYGFDIPSSDAPDYIEYVNNYKAFLETQLKVSEPSMLKGTSDNTTPVMEAINNLFTVLAGRKSKND